MKLFLPVIGIGMLALASAAQAADNLPVKAINNALAGSACTPTSCTGFYIGGGLGGVGTNLDVIGNGLNGSAFAGGMLPTLKLGYLFAQNNWLFGLEATFAYQTNSTASATTAAGTLSGNEAGVLLTQGVKFGGNFNALFGSTATPPVTIPPSLANAVISPYLQAGAAEHQITGGFVSGAYSGVGLLLDTGPHSFVDIDYKNIQYGLAQNGAAQFNMENLITASWNYKF